MNWIWINTMWLIWSVSKFSVFALLFSLFGDQHHTALIIETVMVSHKGLSLPGSPCTLHSDRHQFNRPIQPLVRHPSGPLLPSTWATSNQRPVNNLLLPLVRPLRVPSPSLLYIKGPWMLSEMRGFLETLDCHPLGLLAFWLKSSFLAPTTRIRIYWPVVRWAEQLGLGNRPDTPLWGYWNYFAVLSTAIKLFNFSVSFANNVDNRILQISGRLLLLLLSRFSRVRLCATP